MSDTETELEREIPATTPKGRRPRSSPAAEPAADAAKAGMTEQTPATPETPPTEPAASALAPTIEPAAAEPTPRRRRRAPPSSGLPGEVSPLAKFPMADLLAEIDCRHARAKALMAERNRILATMADLEAEMGIAGSAAPSAAPTAHHAVERTARRQRARNSVSLADALAMAVEPRATVSPAEAAELVLSNGYQSTAKNFGMVVANALAKDVRFARRARGQYERLQS
jgi:hypothetical protein